MSRYEHNTTLDTVLSLGLLAVGIAWSIAAATSASPPAMSIAAPHTAPQPAAAAAAAAGLIATQPALSGAGARKS